MPTATMRLTIHDALETLQRVEGVAARAQAALPRLPWFLSFLRSPLAFLNRHYARQFEQHAHALAAICLKLNSQVSRIRLGGIQEAIDADCSVHNELEQIKASIRRVHHRVAASKASEPLGRADEGLKIAISTLLDLAAETYTAANQLQWEIAEHDVDYLPRQSGYVARTPDESDRILDRILSEG